VIRIRYRGANELAPGLPATAERHGRVITVYLLPDLTAAERDAALRRLRQSGRRGYGPRLPAVPLALALLAAWLRTATTRSGLVFRRHPAGATGPVMLMSAGAIAFLVLSAVSVRILREPRPPAGPSASGPVPAASASTTRTPGSARQPAGVPVGAEDRVLTTAQTGPDPLTPATVPGLPGSGSGSGAGTGTGDPGPGITGTGSMGAGTTVPGSTVPGSTGTGSTVPGDAGTGGGNAGSAPRTPAAPGQPPVTVSVSPSGPASAPSAPGSAPAPGPATSSGAPSATEPAPPPVSVSVAPSASVSASVPVPVVTSAPVVVSVSAAAAVSASLPLPGSAAATSSPGAKPSPVVAVSVTVGACLDVGPTGICLGG